MIRLHAADLNGRQLAIVAVSNRILLFHTHTQLGSFCTYLKVIFVIGIQALCELRDVVARAEDESTGYVLPNKTLIEIGNSNIVSLCMDKRSKIEKTCQTGWKCSKGYLKCIKPLKSFYLWN